MEQYGSEYLIKSSVINNVLVSVTSVVYFLETFVYWYVCTVITKLGYQTFSILQTSNNKYNVQFNER